jgi:CubicO group peptidase (beta-lactamase class C family)
MNKIIQRPGRAHTASDEISWPRSTAYDARMDETALDVASRFAAENKADSLLVIRNGALVIERYWNGKSANDLQQTYSGTKSLFAMMIGRAIMRGYLRGLGHSVRDFVPEMPADQAQLTFRSVLAMQSGMENSPEIGALGQTGLTQLEIALQRKIVAPPFQRYYYNNAAYRLPFTALERAASIDLEALTEAEVFSPLSFGNAHWMRLYAVEATSERFTGYQSIRMTPRDFAKSAQVILDEGVWRGQRFLPANFTKSLVQAPNSSVNPSFGLFHHLNGGAFFRDIAKPEPPIAGPLVPGAPDDMFFMYGNGGQIVAGIPSLRLVIVRTGQDGGVSIYTPANHFAKLMKLIADAAMT